MTLNRHFWGDDTESVQLKILNTFNSIEKAQHAEKVGRSICLSILTGVINHMAPAGQRMPELTAITLLEQSVPTQHTHTHKRIPLNPHPNL